MTKRFDSGLELWYRGGSGLEHLSASKRKVSKIGPNESRSCWIEPSRKTSDITGQAHRVSLCWQLKQLSLATSRNVSD